MPFGHWRCAGYPSDDTTAAVAEYLLLRHKDNDHWPNTSNRPPSEAKPLTTTYVALYGLQSFGTEPQRERIAARTQQVREWLTKTPAKDTEDRVFRLLCLKAAAARGKRNRRGRKRVARQAARRRRLGTARRRRAGRGHGIGCLCDRLGAWRRCRRQAAWRSSDRPINAASRIC